MKNYEYEYTGIRVIMLFTYEEATLVYKECGHGRIYSSYTVSHF